MGRMAEPLRLFCANVKLLPRGLGGSAKDDHRVAVLAKWLLECGPDIVCLQEVFSEDGRSMLKKKLGKHYKHMVAKSDDDDFLHEDSGLFFASRIALDHHRFIEFASAAGSDQFADKGVLGTVLKLPKKRRLLVFNTHMQSSEGYADVRRRQIRQARRFVASAFRKALMKKPKKLESVSVLLVGDLNVIAERPVASVLHPTAEYTRALALLGFPRDLYRETHAHTEPGFTWDGPGNRLAGDADRQRLDYALAFDHIPQPDDNGVMIGLGKLESAKVDVIDKLPPNDEFFSDHYGLMTTFELG